MKLYLEQILQRREKISPCLEGEWGQLGAGWEGPKTLNAVSEALRGPNHRADHRCKARPGWSARPALTTGRSQQPEPWCEGHGPLPLATRLSWGPQATSSSQNRGLRVMGFFNHPAPRPEGHRPLPADRTLVWGFPLPKIMVWCCPFATGGHKKRLDTGVTVKWGTEGLGGSCTAGFWARCLGPSWRGRQRCCREEGPRLCPSPRKPSDPSRNPFSFNGTAVIYRANALIQSTLDHGTGWKLREKIVKQKFPFVASHFVKTQPQPGGDGLAGDEGKPTQTQQICSNVNGSAAA